jgi:hypothetical protein
MIKITREDRERLFGTANDTVLLTPEELAAPQRVIAMMFNRLAVRDIRELLKHLFSCAIEREDNEQGPYNPDDLAYLSDEFIRFFEASFVEHQLSKLGNYR